MYKVKHAPNPAIPKLPGNPQEDPNEPAPSYPTPNPPCLSKTNNKSSTCWTSKTPQNTRSNSQRSQGTQTRI